MTKKTLLTFILFIACSFIAIGESISKNFLIGKWESTEGETWTFSANELEVKKSSVGWYKEDWKIVDDGNLVLTIKELSILMMLVTDLNKGRTRVLSIKKLSNNEIILSGSDGHARLIRK